MSNTEQVPTLPANQVVDATSVSLEHEPLPGEGTGEPPTAGAVPLHERAERVTEIGVWEITPGVTRDVEVHEMMVILSGHATVEVDGGNALELRAGSVLRLEPGSQTTWTVHERLRKVYLILDDNPA